MVLLAIGTGIGCSVILGGRPLRGRGHQAGLLGGHVIVQVGGRPCTCPARGCAEAEASTWALPAIAREDPAFPSSALATETVIDYRAVFRHADDGDDLAVRLRNGPTPSGTPWRSRWCTPSPRSASSWAAG